MSTRESATDSQGIDDNNADNNHNEGNNDDNDNNMDWMNDDDVADGNENESYNSDSDSDSTDSLLSDSSGEREERDRRDLLLLCSLLLLIPSRKRKRRALDIERQREFRTAEYYIRISEREGSFLQEYGMTVDAFRKLVNLLRNDLEPKPSARRSSLDVETKVLMVLRYLRGGSFWDIMRKHGIAKSTFFKNVHSVLDAIDRNPHIGLPKWPTTKEECDAYANEWAKLSGPPTSKGLFTTVIGMLDGILIKIKSPSKSEDICVEDYRSGHKRQIGINVQALCDAKLRFLYVSVLTPGKTNDFKAYEMSELSLLIEKLPEGYWCGGDNAYCTTEHLLSPWPGKKLERDKDSFNFFLSQLRVRIENTFARYVNRWGIFWKPLQGNLCWHARIIRVAARLHNYSIDECVELPSNEDKAYDAHRSVFQTELDRDFGTVVLKDREEWLTTYNFAQAVNGPNLRLQLMAEIESLGYGRSDANLARNMERNLVAV